MKLKVITGTDGKMRFEDGRPALPISCSECAYKFCIAKSISMEHFGLNSGHTTCPGCDAFLHVELTPDINGEEMKSQLFSEYVESRQTAEVSRMKTPAQRAAEKIVQELTGGSYLQSDVEKAAEIIAAEFSQWQPMASAPRDGTAVLLLIGSKEKMPIYFQNRADSQAVGTFKRDGWCFSLHEQLWIDDWLVGWKAL